MLGIHIPRNTEGERAGKRDCGVQLPISVIRLPAARSV